MRHSLAIGFLAMMLTACGGIEAGDYWVYRVAETAPTITDGCYYPDTEPPKSFIDDSTTVRSSNTVVVYHAGEDARVFDDGKIALKGKDVDGGFSFTGVANDSTFLGDDGEVAVLTAMTTYTIEMKVDGRAVSGTTKAATTTKCDFLTPIPSGEFCPNPPVPDCVSDTQWSGVLLDDVRLSERLEEPDED